MAETPKERVLNALLFLTRAELLEIHDKINALLISTVDTGDAVRNYFRQMKNDGNLLEAI